MPASFIRRFDLASRIARDFFRRKAIEGAAEIVALAQNGDPRQSGLEAVENQFLVERAIVEFRHAPFLVVIGDVDRVLFRPGTSLYAVAMENATWSCRDFRLARPVEHGPCRFDRAKPDPAGLKRRSGRESVRDAVKAHECQAMALGG